MKRFIKKIVILFLSCVALVSLISYASLYALKKSAFYKPSYLSQHVERSNYDYIILGASTGLTTLNTELIDALGQINGINLAMDDTSLATQYLMLQHFLYEGKSTDYCILAPSVFDFDVTENIMSGNDYRFMMFNDRDYVQNHYNAFEGTEAKTLKLSKWIPAIGVSYYNVEILYPALQAVVKPEKRNRFDVNGNYVYPLSSVDDQKISSVKDFELAFENPWLSKFEALCQANNIELIYYISPMQGYRALVNSHSNQVINHSDVLRNKKYFYDDIHVDRKGRNVVSELFAERLVKIMK